MSRTYRNPLIKKLLWWREPKHIQAYKLEQSAFEELEDTDLLQITAKRNRLRQRANPLSSTSPPNIYDDLYIAALDEVYLSED